MLNWDYKHEDSKKFEELKEGDYRVRINDVQEATSSKGNQMLVIKLDVSGSNSKLWNYISFLPDRPEITNRMLTKFFNSFGIEEGNFNVASYVGKVGACRVKYDENGKAKVHYFIDKAEQDKLPAWVGDTKPTTNADGFMNVTADEDMPF